MALNSTLNPQYDEIGKGFVQQYYAFFDDPDQRQNLVHLYNVSEHKLTIVIKIHRIYAFCLRINIRYLLWEKNQIDSFVILNIT